MNKNIMLENSEIIKKLDIIKKYPFLLEELKKEEMFIKLIRKEQKNQSITFYTNFVPNKNNITSIGYKDIRYIIEEKETIKLYFFFGYTNFTNSIFIPIEKTQIRRKQILNIKEFDKKAKLLHNYLLASPHLKEKKEEYNNTDGTSLKLIIR